MVLRLIKELFKGIRSYCNCKIIDMNTSLMIVLKECQGSAPGYDGSGLRPNTPIMILILNL